MPNHNKVTLMGNLTRDIELKFTPKGIAVADVSLAINRFFTPEGGEKQEETTFVDVTLFGRQAETAKDYLGKGKPVFIEGRLHLDTWDDRETGQKRSKLKVIGEGLQLLERAPQGENNGGSGQSQRSQAPGSSQGQRSQGGGGGSHQRPAQQPKGGGDRSQPRPAPARQEPDETDDIPF